MCTGGRSKKRLKLIGLNGLLYLDIRDASQYQIDLIIMYHIAQGNTLFRDFKSLFYAEFMIVVHTHTRRDDLLHK